MRSWNREYKSVPSSSSNVRNLPMRSWNYKTSRRNWKKRSVRNLPMRSWNKVKSLRALVLEDCSQFTNEELKQDSGYITRIFKISCSQFTNEELKLTSIFTSIFVIAIGSQFTNEELKHCSTCGRWCSYTYVRNLPMRSWNPKFCPIKSKNTPRFAIYQWGVETD